MCHNFNENISNQIDMERTLFIDGLTDERTCGKKER